MACPSDLKPNILQFDAHPDAFWSAFAAKNPPAPGCPLDAAEILLRMRFEEKYAEVFVPLAGSGLNAYNLPDAAKQEIRLAMLT